MKINIDLKRELFQWGPIDGRLIYPDYFNWGYIEFAKRFFSWPDQPGVFFKERFAYFADYHDLRQSGQKNFYRYLLPSRQFKKYHQEWATVLKDLIKLNRLITNGYLKTLGNLEFNQFYLKWHRHYLNFWVIGMLPELANWGAEEILKERLQRIIPAAAFTEVFEKLAAPEKLSFYQQADLELFALKKFSRRPKQLAEKLKRYQQMHFWLLNSYHHTKVLAVSYFKKELAKISLAQARFKIIELKSHGRQVSSAKKKIIKRYGLKAEVVKIAKRLSDCVWWQDYRKFYIFWSNHCLDVFLKEFSRRFKISFSALHYYNADELARLAATGKRPLVKTVKARQKLLAAQYSAATNKMYYLTGRRAKTLFKKFMSAEKNVSRLTELKGLVVSLGPVVRGRVKIITSPKNAGKMKQGDILVAAMTSPDYIVAMKKARAIITDAGGMTAHAAIVSRELKIPCIVNTKIATKVLKDGDLVEVDTAVGVVKKIN